MKIIQLLSEVNWLSVVVVTIISFPLGMLWHSQKVFGKAWTEDGKPKFTGWRKSNYIRLFSLTAVFHFIAITGLDVLIGPNATALTGLVIGFFVSLLWVSVGIAVTHMFVGRTFRLIAIDAGFYVVYFSIAGLILGAW